MPVNLHLLPFFQLIRFVLMDGRAIGTVHAVEIVRDLLLQVAFDGRSIQRTMRPDKPEGRQTSQQSDDGSRKIVFQGSRSAYQSACAKADEQNQAGGQKQKAVFEQPLRRSAEPARVGSFLWWETCHRQDGLQRGITE